MKKVATGSRAYLNSQMSRGFSPTVSGFQNLHGCARRQGFEAVETVEFRVVVRLIDRNLDDERNALRVGGDSGFKGRTQLLRRFDANAIASGGFGGGDDVDAGFE